MQDAEQVFAGRPTSVHVKISTDLMITVDLRRASGTCCPGTRPGAVSRADQAGRRRRTRRHPGVERRWSAQGPTHLTRVHRPRAEASARCSPPGGNESLIPEIVSLQRLSHESPRTSRHCDILKPFGIDTPDVVVANREIGFVRQPPLGRLFERRTAAGSGVIGV